ncbi:MAG: SpoVT / AbrB like domain protein [Firmicutes bacterium ADurb.Bin456]|nr:MAG: SpoVT / AbrB like domain protein [Firmicutes bacterium ADurb.Bin456]
MAVRSCLTPDGRVTIPRSILKSLGIGGGSSVSISIDKGGLVLKKVEDSKIIETVLPETRVYLKI